MPERPRPPLDDDPPLPPPPPNATRLAFTATVAECIDPASPDLTSCVSINGSGQLVVDGNDGTTESPWESYLRFELDNALDGVTVIGVHLVLTATEDDKAEGPDSGDIWQVTAFDRASLAGAVPSRVGDVPLANSRGSVDSLDVVQWSLPASITDGGVVHLGVITDDDTGGVNYWNLEGRDPPQLLIDVL